MVRPFRIEYLGAFYHITYRGNERKEVFCDNADRRKMIRYFAEAIEPELCTNTRSVVIPAVCKPLQHRFFDSAQNERFCHFHPQDKPGAGFVEKSVYSTGFPIAWLQSEEHFMNESGEKFCQKIHAFCLMKNHYHLEVETLRGDLSRAMHWLKRIAI